MPVAKRCPKCGNNMQMIPDSEWQLHGLWSVDYICPVCLHVERVKCVKAEKEDK